MNGIRLAGSEGKPEWPLSATDDAEVGPHEIEPIAIPERGLDVRLVPNVEDDTRDRQAAGAVRYSDDHVASLHAPMVVAGDVRNQPEIVRSDQHRIQVPATDV